MKVPLSSLTIIALLCVLCAIAYDSVRVRERLAEVERSLATMEDRQKKLVATADTANRKFKDLEAASAEVRRRADDFMRMLGHPLKRPLSKISPSPEIFDFQLPPSDAPFDFKLRTIREGPRSGSRTSLDLLDAEGMPRDLNFADWHSFGLY